jgi:hypothetical protein
MLLAFGQPSVITCSDYRQITVRLLSFTGQIAVRQSFTLKLAVRIEILLCPYKNSKF